MVIETAGQQVLLPAKVLGDIRQELARLDGTGPILDALPAAEAASTPSEVVQAAAVLMDAGLINQAEALYEAGVQAFPHHPGAFIGIAQVATRRRNWVKAMDLWDRAFERFRKTPNPFWTSARAMVLVELGREQEAVDVLSGLCKEYPEQAAGPAGLAQLALRRRCWGEALDRCDELMSQFEGHAATRSWRLMQAGALRELGRIDEAERVAKEISFESPLLLSALLLLLHIYASTGRTVAAWAALGTSPFREIENSALVERRLDLLVRLKRHDEARSLFVAVQGRAPRPDLLESLFDFVPVLYPPSEREPVLNSLIESLRSIERRLGPGETVPCGILKARLYLAARDREGVVSVVEGLRDHPHLGEPGQALRRIASILSNPRFPDYAAPKVFGIGLSRTGTSTLAAALETLGLHTLHWSNPLTGEVISDDDLLLFDGFSDTPISAKFEVLYERFPNAKFILTTRPFEEWAVSMASLWKRQIGLGDFDAIKAELTGSNAKHYGAEFCEINRALYFDFGSFREAYDVYQKRIEAFFRDKPRDRFLEFDIFRGDGWPELCSFLGKEIPAESFPWENRDTQAANIPARA